MDTVIYPGRYESLEEISRHIESVSKAAGFDEANIYAIQTAVDEACTNIIDHAYGGESSGVIIMECITSNDSLKIVLHDHGKPFNPQMVHRGRPGRSEHHDHGQPHHHTSIPVSVNHTRLKDVREGGLGLYFMYRLMDEIYFDFSPDAGNTLVMIKHKPAQ